MEVKVALEAKVHVIPVLVGKATMPKASQLPDEIKRLSYFHATEVRAGRDLGSHEKRLVRDLGRFLLPKYNLRYTCPEISDGVMPDLTLLVSGLTDLETAPQYDGWAAKLNGLWEFEHRDDGAGGFARDCERAQPVFRRVHVAIAQFISCKFLRCG